MNQISTGKNQSILNSSEKLTKLKYLLQKSKTLNMKGVSRNNEEYSMLIEKSANVSPDFSLYLSLIEKPINLLFSLDQFLFEFSKKTYQQKKVGEFFQQLKERKKLSLFYGGLSRKYINNIFNKAKTAKGSLSKNVLGLLERRLDVVLYRSGLTKTIAEARQFILHKKILINQKPVNFPAYLVEPGDIISITSKTITALNLEFSNSKFLVPNFSNLAINVSFEKNLTPGASHFIEDKGFKTKSIKSHPKIFGDFYSKLKKSLSKPVSGKQITKSDKLHEKDFSGSFFQKKEGSSNFLLNKGTKENRKRSQRVGWSGYQFRENFRSRLLCSLFINLLCTQIKTRSYFDLKKNYQTNNKIIALILYKKSKGFSFQKERNFFNENSFRKNQRDLKNLQQSDVNVMESSLKKKPVIWSQRITSSKHKKNWFLKNQKTQNIWKQKHGKKNLILDKYRYCFLHFLKSLDNYKKFSGLLHLNLKKSMYKKSFYKRKTALSNTLSFRVLKPIHLEVSYKLLNIIYLYSPQRLNYPFLIDLDVINRSLS